MDRRIAERRRQVSEDKARGRLRWVIWLVAGVTLAGVLLWLINSPVLAVREVTVTGAEHSDPAGLAAELGIEPGTPTLSVRAGNLERSLETTDPWIESATVTVTWPGAVEIDVVERVPIVTIATPDGAFLVGEDAMLLTGVDGDPAPPVITTEGVGVTRAGNRVTHRATAAAIAFVGGLSPEVRRMTTVTVAGDDVSADVGGMIIVIGRPKDMAEKAAAVEALLGTDLEPGSRIDVTAPTRPAVAPPQSLVEGETKTLEESQPSD
jgi:cell division protein FtsQ